MKKHPADRVDTKCPFCALVIQCLRVDAARQVRLHIGMAHHVEYETLVSQEAEVRRLVRSLKETYPQVELRI